MNQFAIHKTVSDDFLEATTKRTNASWHWPRSSMDRMSEILGASSRRCRDRSQRCYHDLIDIWRNWPHYEMLNADTTFSARKFREKGDIEPAYAKLSALNELFVVFSTIPGLNGWVGRRYSDYRQPRWYHLTSCDMIWRGWSFGLRKQMLSHSDQIDRYVSIRLQCVTETCQFHTTSYGGLCYIPRLQIQWLT